ncbi:hypothetical protein SADUNF_Sadunf10G0054700 [Salix dunnii]|uniref:Uncharacterized protein n=1 Tax=Salix dunnii TaxID=1413687 RepID=A0A835MP41_9ROSI|nr:hypothetical protein SADUNF_Sadunf10G0054700 [Salix dunnii]
MTKLMEPCSKAVSGSSKACVNGNHFAANYEPCNVQRHLGSMASMPSVSLPEYVDVMVSCWFHFVQFSFQWLAAFSFFGDVTFGIRLRKMTGVVGPYEAAKRRKNSKEIENVTELPPDVPSVCVDGTVLDPVPTPVNVSMSKLIAKQSLTRCKHFSEDLLVYSHGII